jgi:hypothetical protein
MDIQYGENNFIRVDLPLTKVYHDNTLFGDGTRQRPLRVIGGGGSNLPPLDPSTSGLYLTNDGTNLSWGVADALPTQTGNANKLLTTNGVTASWSSNLTWDAGLLNIGGYIRLGNTVIPTYTQGNAYWNPDYKTLSVDTDVNGVHLSLAQDQVFRVKNGTTAIIPKGTAVKAIGTHGNSGTILVAPASALAFDISNPDTMGDSHYFMGLALHDIPSSNDDGVGFVTAFGRVRGLNTTGGAENWATGDVLYLSTTTGQLTKIEPTGPNYKIVVALVISSHTSNGTLFVRVSHNLKLEDVHNVNITSPQNNQVLAYNSTSKVWVNQAAPATGITGSGSNGQVSFWTGTSSQGGSNNLFWDNANGRLGIGTTSPLSTISVITPAIAGREYIFKSQISDAGDDSFFIGNSTNEVSSYKPLFGGYGLNTTRAGLSFGAYTITSSDVSTPTDIYSSLITFFTAITTNSSDPSNGTLTSISNRALFSFINLNTCIMYMLANGNIGIGQTNFSTNQARLQVQGAGSTAATNALLVQNSSTTELLKVGDGGRITINKDVAVTTQSSAVLQVQSADTNTNLVLQPKGSGAIIVGPPPDGTATGGNARGTNAIDLQSSRSNANQVAAGSVNVIVGGIGNRTTGYASFVGGGANNFAQQNYTTIAGGQNNSSSNNNTFIGAGQNNTIAATHASIVGGLSNSIPIGASWGFIGGGELNSSEGIYTAISGGNNNIASANYSSISGGFRALTSIFGQRANASGRFAANSDAQSSSITFMREITGPDGFELLLTTPNITIARAVMNLPTGATLARAWRVNVDLIAICHVVGNGSTVLNDVFGGSYQCTIKRVGSTVSMVGSPVTIDIASDGSMSTSIVTLQADTGNNALRISWKSPTTAGTTTVVRVVATAYITEVGR